MKKSIAIILSIMLILVITLPAAAVSTIAVKSITLGKNKVTLKVGQTSNLKVTFTPANTSQKKLTYVSGNKKVATVNTTGVITGVHAGNTTITVYTLNKKIFAKCYVTISQPVKKEVKTFTLTMFTDWYKQGWEAVQKEINSKSDTLGFKLEIEKIAGGSTGEQLLKARFAASEIPDFVSIFNAQYAWQNLNGEKTMVDISGPWTDNYDLKTLQSSLYSINGKIVALPIDGSHIGGMLYNKKVFSALNLKIPNTWAELLNACEKIKAAGKVPVYYSGKDSWTLQILPISGFSREFKSKNANELMDAINTNKAKFVDQKLFIDTLVKSKELVDKGYVNKTYLSDTYANAQKALAEGSTAMYPMATWVLDEIAKAYPDKINDIGGFAIPFDGNDYAPAWMPNSLMMTTSCKDPDLGKQVINYLGSQEVQSIYFKAQPAIPLIKGIDVTLYPASKELYKIFTTKDRGGPIFQLLQKYSFASFDKICQDVLVDGKTSEQAAKALDSETSKNAKAKGDTNFN